MGGTGAVGVAVAAELVWVGEVAGVPGAAAVGRMAGASAEGRSSASEASAVSRARAWLLNPFIGENSAQVS